MVLITTYVISLIHLGYVFKTLLHVNEKILSNNENSLL
jgi:hypothetical protein